jgi:hypothetical protein
MLDFDPRVCEGCRLFAWWEELKVGDEGDVKTSRSSVVYILARTSAGRIHPERGGLTKPHIPPSLFKSRPTRTHFPLIASCSTVVSGTHISPTKPGGTKHRVIAISDTGDEVSVGIWDVYGTHVQCHVAREAPMRRSGNWRRRLLVRSRSTSLCPTLAGLVVLVRPFRNSPRSSLHPRTAIRVVVGHQDRVWAGRE